MYIIRWIQTCGAITPQTLYWATGYYGNYWTSDINKARKYSDKQYALNRAADLWGEDDYNTPADRIEVVEV